MNTDDDRKRRVQERLSPDRGAQVAPPARPTRPAEDTSTPSTSKPTPEAPPASGRQTPPESRPKRRTKPTRSRHPASHSVPQEIVARVVDVAHETRRTYADIVIECILNRFDELGDKQEQPLDVFERRVQEANREPRRTTQLTIYVSPDEREKLEEYARQLGMKRSHLVTQALERGLDDIQ